MLDRRIRLPRRLAGSLQAWRLRYHLWIRIGI